MYESFFRLKARPFAAAPAVHNYYPGEAIEQARQTCIRAIERAEGPVLVIGPAGVGKTLLCRLLAAYFESAFHVALLSNTQIGTHKSLLQNILFELGLPYRDADEGELRLRLIDFLQPSDECPHGLLLIVDEAHTLPIRLLEELRMLTNVVRNGQPRARLVLAGGPRLDERFAHPKLESFNQRVAARCYLPPMGRMETDDYVRSQLALAGGSADLILAEEAFRSIFQATDGIPRLVNQVCNHALTLACQSGCRKLEAANIEQAWADLQQLPAPWHEKHVETDNARAFIEFGQLEEEADPARSPLETPFSPVERCDEMLELLSSGQSESGPSIMFGSMAAEIEAAQGFECPAPEEALLELAPEQPAGPVVEPALDPFAVPFAEEEVIQDYVALAARQPMKVDSRPPSRSQSHTAAPPHTAPASAESAGIAPEDPLPVPSPPARTEVRLPWGTGDLTEDLLTGMDDRTPRVAEPSRPTAAEEDAAWAAEDPRPAAVQTSPVDESQVEPPFAQESLVEESLPAVAPAASPALANDPPACDLELLHDEDRVQTHGSWQDLTVLPVEASDGDGSGYPEMFEFTILQQVQAGSSLLDAAGAQSARSAQPAEVEEDGEKACVSFRSEAGLLDDDRDLIQVADEEDARAALEFAEDQGGNVRRVEYRELFAQLRRQS